MPGGKTGGIANAATDSVSFAVAVEDTAAAAAAAANFGFLWLKRHVSMSLGRVSAQYQKSRYW
jgi:hypothetical protein